MKRTIKRIVRWVIEFAMEHEIQSKIYVIDPQSWHHNTQVDGFMPQFVKIGRNFISAPGSMIIAHDYSYFIFTDKCLIQPVEIGDDVFLGAGAIVMPGVKIGNRVVIGAGSIVTHDIPDDSVVVGNPARIIHTVQEYLQKAESEGVLYSISYTKSELRKQLGLTTEQQTNQARHYAINEYRRRNPGQNTWIQDTSGGHNWPQQHFQKENMEKQVVIKCDSCGYCKEGQVFCCTKLGHPLENGYAMIWHSQSCGEFPPVVGQAFENNTTKEVTK